MLRKPSIDEVKGSVLHHLRIGMVMMGSTLKNPDACARYESVLWKNMPQHVKRLDEFAWHVLVWHDHDAETPSSLLLIENTRRDLSDRINRGYFEVTARGLKNAEYMAWRRAWLQFGSTR